MIFATALQKAVRRGLQVSGRLATELRQLGEVSVNTRREAKSICSALERLIDRPLTEEVLTDLGGLAGLFLQVESRGAFLVLVKRGLPLLASLFDRWSEKVTSERSDPMMSILQVFANYRYSPGTDRIISALTGQLWPDVPMWHFVLVPFKQHHPEVEKLLDGAARCLPVEKAAVSLLSVANKACQDNPAIRHPFASEDGADRLMKMLRSQFSRNLGDASLAVKALPYMQSVGRDDLLQVAVEHNDEVVAMEAAYVCAKQGKKFGLDKLVEACMDPRLSQMSKGHLRELGSEDRIPPQAYAPAHLAMEEFATWLSDPRELGRIPDEISIFDERRLFWPPHGSTIQVWLIRYRSVDKLGMNPDRCDCGFVGGMTFCYFSLNTHRRPPEDTYGYHCTSELEDLGRVEIVEVEPDDPRATKSRSWTNAVVIVDSLTHLARLKNSDAQRDEIVVVAPARQGDQAGWVVRHVDDQLLPTSESMCWYSGSEQPEFTSESMILKMHVGRFILGLPDPVDRARFLDSSQPESDPQRLIDGYELLIEEALQGTSNVQKEIFGSFSRLTRYHDEYMTVLASVTGKSEAELRIEFYRRIKSAVERCPSSLQPTLTDTLSVLGCLFHGYVDALFNQGKLADIDHIREYFADRWDDLRGAADLGYAAMRCGRLELAEQYFLQVLDEGSYHRWECMSDLAEMWFQRGEVERASTLLIDCMHKLVDEVKRSEYQKDRDTYNAEYQHHRGTYLRLFPDQYQQLIEKALPEEP